MEAPVGNTRVRAWPEGTFHSALQAAVQARRGGKVDYIDANRIVVRVHDTETAAAESMATDSVIDEREYYEYVHFSDAVMTDQEILELKKTAHELFRGLLL